MNTSNLRPGQIFPPIKLPLLGGGEADIAKPIGDHDWKLVLVYRGKHCPLCTNYLQELENIREELSEIGIDIIAVSADSETRAAAHLAEINTEYPVAYGLNQEQMKDLGLYISGPQNGMNVEGPFAEPGLFIINHEGKLQLVDISNVPFSRPSLSNIVGGMKWLRGQTQEFPINGTYM
jgi:peroxiredoxin